MVTGYLYKWGLKIMINKTMKKVLTGLFFFCITCTVLWLMYTLIGAMFITGSIFPSIKSGNAERQFQRHKTNMTLISEYFCYSGYDNIYIHNTTEKGMMSVSGKNVVIESKDIIEAIEKLKKRGVEVISKEGNTVYFQLWSGLDDGRGVAYSIDGSPPILQFLTRLEPLSELNWYYYEEDYNEWRITGGLT